MHQKASFIDYRGEEMGSKSEIMGVTINDPNKGRGKRGRKVVFEEAGSFKNLKQTLEVTMGSMRDNEVIAAANEHNIAMVFTGMRHFRH